MPKSPGSSSHTDGETDTTVRKKRNAKGQAAFRAKRSQYIASLEETVLRLESALVQYQEEWRGSQDEIYKTKEDNEKMRLEQRQHEALLEAMYRRGELPELADVLKADPSLLPVVGDVIKLLPLSPSASLRASESPTYPTTLPAHQNEGSSRLPMAVPVFLSPSNVSQNTVGPQSPIIYGSGFQPR
ncbi:hypothetical protein CVT26_009460 [Gymnopilus dilepis]|uniref:BZIP domain-containing protein n=1 Tax=Gymnopilus dilepis TaxID=231916 RepID=A0A409YI93_9AGAR|nr:hypothetical protein CVT26_009460 [Gymnopilus dilepis]